MYSVMFALDNGLIDVAAIIHWSLITPYSIITFGYHAADYGLYFICHQAILWDNVDFLSIRFMW